MGILTSRDGGLSLVRVSLLVGAVGIVIIVAGVVSFMLDQQARRTPLFIDQPLGAEQWGRIDERGPGWQFVYYRVADGDIEAIVQHYRQKMSEHYNVALNDPRGETCQRHPRAGEFPDHDLSAGLLPFYYSCMFDRGGLNTTQWTYIRIQPGVPSEDPLLDAEGDVVIVYEQRWTP